MYMHAPDGFAAPRMLGNIVRTVKVEERREYPAAIHNAKKSNDIGNVSASTELFKFVTPHETPVCTGELVLKEGFGRMGSAGCLSSQCARTAEEFRAKSNDWRVLIL